MNPDSDATGTGAPVEPIGWEEAFVGIGVVGQFGRGTVRLFHAKLCEEPFGEPCKRMEKFLLEAVSTPFRLHLVSSHLRKPPW